MCCTRCIKQIWKVGKVGKVGKGVCHASMHSFFIDCQSLRELRITGVLIIAATQKEMWAGSKCNGPMNFSHTVKKSYLFLEGRCKFPAPSLQKFVGDTGKFFPFPKALFLCFQRGKPFHSGERVWGLRNMTKIWEYDIMTMGLVYPLSEHVDIFPVRLVPTFH